MTKPKMDKLNSLEPQIVAIPVVEKTFEVNLEKLYADEGPMIKALKAKKNSRPSSAWGDEVYRSFRLILKRPTRARVKRYIESLLTWTYHPEW
jgi:hypothetical protein